MMRQLAVGDHPEVTGAQPGPGRRAWRRIVDAAAEDLCGQFGLVPVTQRDVVAARPDLADGAGGLLEASLRIDDADRVRRRPAVADQFGAALVGGHTALGDPGRQLSQVETGGADGVRDGRRSDVQRRLGQAVGGPDDPFSETNLAKRSMNRLTVP